MNVIYGQRHSIATATFIPRPDFVASLSRQREPGLIVLAASTGYGKTWLAEQVASVWAAEAPEGRVRIWSLHASMTPAQALSSLCLLLGQRVVPSALTSDAIADAALLALASDRDSRQGLVIDVDGAPPSKPVLTLVGQVLLNYVSRGRVLVACRNLWSLPIDRIAANSPSRLLRAADLAIRPDEWAASPASAGAPQRWLDVTEGWPVLSTLPASLRGTAGTASSDSLLIDTAVNWFAEYLEHVVLSSMSPRDVRLLMQVSVFEVIEPGILEAAGLSAAWSKLVLLIDTGLPVSPGCKDWDKTVLNAVFRRFLERRLQGRLPAQYEELHRHAADYFVAAGSYIDAIRHALRIGDATLEASITEQCGGWRVSWRHGLRALGEGRATLPQLSKQFPKAALARIYWQVQTGRIGDACSALDRLREHVADAGLKGDFQAIEYLISIYRDEPFVEHRFITLADFSSAPYEEEPLLLPGRATLQAAMLNNAGMYERGASISRVAIAEVETLQSEYISFYGHLHFAMALHGLGQVTDAIAEYLTVRTLAEEIFGAGSSECRMVALLAAQAHWLAGDDDQAERTIGDLDGLWRLHAWLEPYRRGLEIAVTISRRRNDRVLEKRVLQDFALLAQRRTLSRLDLAVQLARIQSMDSSRLDLMASRCDALLQTALAFFPDRTSTAASVLAPIWLTKARITLQRGSFGEASKALQEIINWSDLLQDGALLLETDLLTAYVALRARRYRDVSLALSQCVLRMEQTGLRRPFLDNSALVLEIVDYAKTHALNIDAAVLQQAAAMALAPGERIIQQERNSPSACGHLLLTDRELDILHLLVDGLSSKEMARRLAIAVGTVKTHRRHLYEKLGSGLRAQALARARELGFL